MLHRTRALLIRQRTMLANAFRAHLAEFGIIVAQGIGRVASLIERIFGDGEEAAKLPRLARSALAPLAAQFLDLAPRIKALEAIASQMVHARDGDLCTALGLGEDEGALQDGLGVQGEALRRPFRANFVTLHRFGDVGLDLRCMEADAVIASVADRGIGVVDFLHHRPDEANRQFFGQSKQVQQKLKH
jgi:hypothetical protein